MPSIPQARMTLYLIAGGLVPIFLVIFYLSEQLTQIDQLSKTLDRVADQAAIHETKQASNTAIKEHYMGADRFYIDKYLETLKLLKPETNSLEQLVNNRYFAGDETVRKRLNFLKGQDNAFLFSEGNVQSYPFFQETIATLIKPVEVNLEDLKNILALIEGQPIDQYTPGPKKPQMIILDFKLDKKEASENNEVFLLNIKILKREYLEP